MIGTNGVRAAAQTLASQLMSASAIAHGLPPIQGIAEANDNSESALDPEMKTKKQLERLRTVGLSLAEFLELQFPPKQYIIEGLVETDAVHVAIGPPNAGKTFLVVDIAIRAAADGWRILFYEAEGSPAALQTRVRRTERAHPVTVKENLRVIHNSTVDLSTAAGAERVIEQAIAHGAQLVIFDSLAAMSGSIDENDSAAMGNLANTLNEIKVAANVAVFVLHHTTKEAWKPDETPTLRHLRGHGVLAGRVDIAFAIAPIDTLVGEVSFNLHDLKQRDAARRPAPLRCTVTMTGDVAHFQIEETEVERVASERPLATSKAAADAKRKQLREAVLERMPLLGSGRLPQSKSRLRDELKKKDVDVANAVDDLIDEGLVCVVGGWNLFRKPSSSDSSGKTPEDQEGPTSSASSHPLGREEAGEELSEDLNNGKNPLTNSSHETEMP